MIRDQLGSLATDSKAPSTGKVCGALFCAEMLRANKGHSMQQVHASSSYGFGTMLGAEFHPLPNMLRFYSMFGT